MFIKPALLTGFRQRGLFVETEKPIPVVFEKIKMECGYRADLVVERKIIVDTKNIEANSGHSCRPIIDLLEIFKS